ncbi:MAG: ComEC family competence protein [Bacteroidetes bacterium]|nr:ComEC family competence protein [Bacteroidota bacterium]
MHLKIWNQAPLVRLILPFLTGIIVAVCLPVQFKYVLQFIFVLVLILSAIIIFPKLNISYKNSWWFGLLINSTLFCSSYQLTISKTEKLAADHFSKFTDNTTFVYAKLTEPYHEKTNSLKVVMQIIAVKQNNEWKHSSGKAMVYLKKDTKALQLKYGDELILKANFKEIPPAQNPGEFDYKSFLAFHNIFHQAYLKSNDWTYSGDNSGNPIIKCCISLRNNLLNTFRANHLQGEEFAVGAALLLGYVDQLDADIISSYANTGALHILSVSGLHVAIIYVVFNWLLFFFDKIKYGNIIKAILLILFLWFYAALTGLSPSVLRAAAMFSFIVIAKSFNRHTNIYNTLAASAFLLLTINPYLIMDVGFQLSYIAVLGIVYIYPKIYNWFEIHNSILNQIWAVTVVSIAAQIATFPLGLYYFHQFPNYFLLTNFIVIPVSTLIIYTGIALLALAKVSIAVIYLAQGFSYAVWFLNESVRTIEKWPYSLAQGISITLMETCLIYTLIILLFYYFSKRKSHYLMYALSIAVIILCMQIKEQSQQYQQKKLVIYNIPKTYAIDFISSKRNVLLTDSILAKNESSLLYHIKHYWWNLGLNETKIISENIQTKNLNIRNNFILFFNTRILIVSDLTILKKALATSLKPLILDYIIISKNPILHIQDVLKTAQTNKIIFDSSNSDYNISKWKNECALLKQSYYSVKDEGALVVDL